MWDPGSPTCYLGDFLPLLRLVAGIFGFDISFRECLRFTSTCLRQVLPVVLKRGKVPKETISDLQHFQANQKGLRIQLHLGRWWVVFGIFQTCL